ncbi:hypothetical protein ASD97_24600 [Streptomyces sp. Root63]|uniref:hypothetical protein n=1 Tax=Streptomyces TaxID=1883 RepID=UPI0006FC5CDB|nr:MULTISPECIES: hypothetical protein [unclassified Streptomyces]KQX27486.1 hypothetical protein ASD29_29830 [Streptomyces sp. Root1295]KRA34726.1 hypothetical protein ASD97_24600 [Streptomyces sp. Root63]WTC69760.1 hypothetical protein OG882_05200 [Streptomyces anulatus]
MSLISAISRSKPKHRAVDAVANLRDENRRLLTQLFGARDYIAIQEQQLADVRAKRDEAELELIRVAAERDDRAEERDQALAEASRLRAQLAPYLAADANANAVTVPASERDTSRFEDQATEPIKVTTLREAFGIGPVVATQGSTDPAHLPAA